MAIFSSFKVSSSSVSFLCAGPPVAERSPRTAGVRVFVGAVGGVGSAVLGAAFCGAGAGLEVEGGGIAGSDVDVVVS